MNNCIEMLHLENKMFERIMSSNTIYTCELLNYYHYYTWTLNKKKLHSNLNNKLNKYRVFI